MPRRIPHISVLIAVVFGLLVSCTPVDKNYRSMSLLDRNGTPIDLGCSTASRLIDDTFITAKTSDDNNAATGPRRTVCSLGTYLVPNAEKWAALAGGGKIGEPDRYSLAFVELPERKKTLPNDQQMVDLRAHLSADTQQIVMIYVHGWRHDADIGNGNVRRFRTMLGYTRSALNSRCIETGAYCDATLTGVYVGWRGRSFAEPTENDASVSGLPGAITTIWGRKLQSERLARAEHFELSFEGKSVSPIGYVLKNIQDELDLEHGDPKHDKMMVLGHSLGGNMLATYLEPIVKDKITGGHTMGDYMAPPLGDLVVLLNPASEAEKWTSLQKAMREEAGISPETFAVSRPNDTPAEEWRKVERWKRMFRADQRPFYVSITSTNDWSSVETNNRSDEKIRYDKPTGLTFPIAQSLVLKTSKHRRTTIGHLVAPYKQSDRPKRLTPSGPPYGASHEMITNSGGGAKTSYRNSGDPKAAKCQSHDGWLAAAYARQKEPGKDNWDTGSEPKRALLNKMNGAELQIRHALYLKEDKEQPRGTFAESVSQGRNPLWNIRAYDTAVHGHSGFINFPTLCGINIMWLDDATKGGE